MLPYPISSKIPAGQQLPNFNCYICGQPVKSSKKNIIYNPYNGEAVGQIKLASQKDALQAVQLAVSDKPTLSRHERSSILLTAGQILEQRMELFSKLISLESGLCIQETRHETQRAIDVIRFAAMEALRDDGQIFPCDTFSNGKKRKIFTTREPLSLALAITPFNHPLNQVAHKIIPALAAGTPIILKPSEQTPLTAIRFAELLYEAGLPPKMLSVLLGTSHKLVDMLIRDPRVAVISFTGSAAIGKQIAQKVGYKKLMLELGGNDPMIILADADLDLAAELAAEGAFRNSGQRCTAVKRILVQNEVHDEFIEKLIRRATLYTVGDPADPNTGIGTMISEQAASKLEKIVELAVAKGASIVFGGRRHGAQFEPTVITQVSRDAQMIVEESFGPLAPIIAVNDLNDAIDLANATAYGLSSAVITNDLKKAITAVKQLKAGTVNINEVPGYRMESSPFGGIKDSGLGIKEGVIEAMKFYSFVKTFSLPW